MLNFSDAIINRASQNRLTEFGNLLIIKMTIKNLFIKHDIINCFTPICYPIVLHRWYQQRCSDEVGCSNIEYQERI